MDKLRIHLQDFLMCMSAAQDLISTSLSNHHQKVAYLSLHLARELGLPFQNQRDIFLASLVHDIGALSIDEQLEIIEAEPLTIHSHAFKGAKLFEIFRPLNHVTDIIKFHHVSWENGNGLTFLGQAVPFTSHIIHLADRTCSMIKPGINVLNQLPEIFSELKSQSGEKFAPNAVEALISLSSNHSLWLDLVSRSPISRLPDVNLFNVLTLDIDDIIDIAHIFSQIIDFRSSFTSRHSAGVAKSAERLALLSGFSPYECKLMLVAGYLHDLGKIAISNKVLEKPDKLTPEEQNIMKTHTYYTYHLLAPIPQFQTINTWASYHHERLDGNGYPFQIKGENLSLGSRIMAVADVFTAITENRPYRKGMDDEAAIQILNNMVKNGGLDGRIVQTLVDHFYEVNELRQDAQEEATRRYNQFIEE